MMTRYPFGRGWPGNEILTSSPSPESSQMKTDRRRRTKAQIEQDKADAWNNAHGIGTEVRYWRGIREGEGKIGFTRSLAEVMGDHTAVVWITGNSGPIALTHVEPLKGDAL